MNKLHFFVKLVPSRPTFSQDMTDEERKIMVEHIAYWKAYMAKGMVVVFGPVMDPAGVYGVGVLSVDNEDQVKEITGNDPASAINHYEIYPIRAITPDQLS
jgi:uncharacterized protein YciI